MDKIHHGTTIFLVCTVIALAIFTVSIWVGTAAHETGDEKVEEEVIRLRVEVDSIKALLLKNN